VAESRKVGEQAKRTVGQRQTPQELIRRFIQSGTFDDAQSACTVAGEARALFSFMLYFLWLASIARDETSRLGYYGIATSFLISLIPALEAVFGRGDNPNELLFKASN
jgi:hypothetical protein